MDDRIALGVVTDGGGSTAAINKGNFGRRTPAPAAWPGATTDSWGRGIPSNFAVTGNVGIPLSFIVLGVCLVLLAVGYGGAPDLEDAT